MIRTENLFYNRGNEKKTLDNLIAKFSHYTRVENEETDKIFEKVCNFFINNIDFVIIDHHNFMLNFEDSGTISTKQISTKTIESTNYLWIIENIKQELLICDIILIEDFSSIRLYGRYDIRSYKTRLRYTIEDITPLAYLLDNKKAMTFKEFVTNQIENSHTNIV